MMGRKTIFDPATFKQMKTFAEDGSSDSNDPSADTLKNSDITLFDDPSHGSNKEKLVEKDHDEY